MNVRRILVCGLVCAALAGIASAAPGDKLYDSMASGEGQIGLAIIEGETPNALVIVSYLNMDDVPGLSEGDDILATRTRHARAIKVRSGDVVIRGGSSPLVAR